MSEACDRTRELAAELALGILDGEERGEALAHLSRCPGCRRHVEELSATADELTLLAPRVEPPPGFEARVLGRLPLAGTRGTHRRPALRWRTAAAAVAASALAALAAWFATHADRELASRYRDTLAVADGRYFTAKPLARPSGNRVGTVFGYAGEQSWCMVLVRSYEGEPAVSDGSYAVELVRTDGRRARMGRLVVRGGSGSLGSALGFEYRELRAVRILRPDGSVLATATLH